MPGCSQPADRCDIDHVIPARPDPVTDLPTLGPTVAENLAPECRHHHLAKDGNGGFHLKRHPDGSYTWTTPLGREYRHQPDPLWHPPPDGTENGNAVGEPASRDVLGHHRFEALGADESASWSSGGDLPDDSDPPDDEDPPDDDADAMLGDPDVPPY